MILHQMKQRHSVTIIITPELKQQHIWLHAYPEVQHKATNKTFQIQKKKKNFLQTLELKSMLSLFEIRLHATQESLLTSSKAQAFITSSYCSSSYFFPNKMLLFKVPGNTQGCWETYVILPSTLTFPWLGGSSPSTALNSEDGNRQQRTHVNTVHSGRNTTHSTADPTLVLDTRYQKSIKYSFGYCRKKKWKRAIIGHRKLKVEKEY